MRSLLNLLRPYRRSVVVALVVACATSIPGLLTLLAMGFVVDAVRAGDAGAVTRWSLALAGLAVLGALLWVPRSRSTLLAAVDTEADLRARLFDRILRTDLRTLGSVPSGQVLARTTADLRLVRSLLSGGIPVVASVIAGYAFLVVTAGYHHPWLGIATVVPVGLVLAVSILRARAEASAPLDARRALGDATTAIDETLESIAVVRADGSAAAADARVTRLVDRARQALTPALARNARFTALVGSVPYLAFAGVLAVGGVLVTRGSGVSLGELVTVSLLMLQVAGPTVALGSLVAESQGAAAAATRIEEVLAWPDGDGDPRTVADRVEVRRLRVGEGPAPIVRDVDLDLPPGASLAIETVSSTDAVATLQALHGMRSDIAGSILAPASTALVTCEDDVFPGTLRDAVAYPGIAVDDAAVDEAAERAGLDTVVAGLPQGWQTPIGGRTGTVLSGGQLQRVRLARALLRDADLLMLDSPLLGLDATTAAHVRDGLARERAGRSFIVTASRAGDLAPATLRGRLDDGVLSVEEAADEAGEPAPGVPTASPPTTPVASKPAPAPAPQHPHAHEAGGSTPSQDRHRARERRRRASRMRRAAIVSLLRPDAGWVALAVLAVAVAALTALAPIAIGMALIDDLAGPAAVSRVPQIVALLLALAVVAGIATFAAELLVPWIGLRVLGRLRLRAFRALLSVHLAYFDRQRVGAIVSKLTNNIELLDTAIRGGARTAVSGLVTLVAVATLLAVLDAELAAVAYVVFPVIVVLALVLQRAQRWALHRNIAGISDLTDCIRDAVRGGATIRSYRAQELHRREFDRLNELERSALLRSAYLFKAFAAVSQLVVALDVALIVLIGGQDAVSGAVAVTTMVLFATYIQNGVSPISTLATMQAVYGQSGVALDQVVGVANLPRDPNLAPDRDRTTGDPAAPALRYAGVWFAYTKAGWVLTDTDLEVARGEHLVIVGRSGGGKSSLVKLALRFYAPIRGDVEVFGVPIGQADERWLRSQLAYVPQEPVTMTGTLRENLLASRTPADPGAARDGDPSVDKDIAAVVDALGIGMSVVEALGGLDATIGSAGPGEGTAPTAAQRQLIAIARALLSRRPMVILDEATSYLDEATEARVIAALRVLEPGLTVVAIAHHLRWATLGDSVALVSGHRVREHGRHDELLAAGGEYARLWRAHDSAVR